MDFTTARFYIVAIVKFKSKLLDEIEVPYQVLKYIKFCLKLIYDSAIDTSIIQMLLSLLCIGALIVLIASLKSLHPRYVLKNQRTDLSVSVTDAQQIYKQLPWSQTKVESERCEWINQTMSAIWPSIKHLLHENVINKFLERQAIISKVKLGGSSPMIDGISYVGRSNCTYSDLGDDCNMRFVMETYFRSDDNFSVQLNTIPALGLTKIFIALRLMITVNHSRVESSNNLEIFDTPGNALIPAINYVRINIVDVPRIDWHANVHVFQEGLKDRRRKLIGTLVVSVVNNIYFKFIAHCLLSAAYSWFPFEIKISDKLYIMSIGQQKQRGNQVLVKRTMLNLIRIFKTLFQRNPSIS